MQPYVVRLGRTEESGQVFGVINSKAVQQPDIETAVKYVAKLHWVFNVAYDVAASGFYQALELLFFGFRQPFGGRLNAGVKRLRDIVLAGPVQEDDDDDDGGSLDFSQKKADEGGETGGGKEEHEEDSSDHEEAGDDEESKEEESDDEEAGDEAAGADEQKERESASSTDDDFFTGNPVDVSNLRCRSWGSRGSPEPSDGARASQCERGISMTQPPGVRRPVRITASQCPVPVGVRGGRGGRGRGRRGGGRGGRGRGAMKGGGGGNRKPDLVSLDDDEDAESGGHGLPASQELL